MKGNKTCSITAIATKSHAHILERQDDPGVLIYSEKPRLTLEGYANVNRYHLYLSYHDRVIASTDPSLKVASIPHEIIKFYARVNGIDEVMVKFRREPRMIFRKEGALEWPELLQIPLLKGEEVQVELPKSFNVNYFRSNT